MKSLYQSVFRGKGKGLGKGNMLEELDAKTGKKRGVFFIGEEYLRENW